MPSVTDLIDQDTAHALRLLTATDPLEKGSPVDSLPILTMLPAEEALMRVNDARDTLCRVAGRLEMSVGGDD